MLHSVYAPGLAKQQQSNECPHECGLAKKTNIGTDSDSNSSLTLCYGKGPWS